MMEKNPYYNPEDCGVKIAATLDGGGGYDFDMVLVVRELATGKLWWAADSGCSCYSPFEYQGFPDDFERLRSWSDVRQAAAECYGVSADELLRFQSEVRQALVSPVIGRAVEKAAQVAVDAIEAEPWEARAFPSAIEVHPRLAEKARELEASLMDSLTPAGREWFRRVRRELDDRVLLGEAAR